MLPVKLAKSQKNGFTLIELLLVVAMIGILSGSLVKVINQERQKEYAEDSVARQHLDKAAQAMETYYAAERSYPDQGGAAQDPTQGADSATVAYYLEVWPAGLVYNKDATGFSIHIRKSSTTDYFKYNSIWKQIMDCADGTDENSVSDCD